MEKQERMFRIPEDAFFQFCDELIKKFAPQEARFLSHRELLEYIESWVDENFELYENDSSIGSEKSKICPLPFDWLNDL